MMFMQAPNSRNSPTLIKCLLKPLETTVPLKISNGQTRKESLEPAIFGGGDLVAVFGVAEDHPALEAHSVAFIRLTVV